MTVFPANPSRSTWDAWTADGRGFRQLTDGELERFTLHLPPHRGRVAVDASCGIGVFSRQLQRFGYDVTGIDYSDAALTAARRTGMPHLRYLNHDLDTGDPPGLPQHGIDLVVCRFVLPFLHDPADWTRRVRDRWLRPGGWMYIVTPSPTDRPRNRAR
ncbi:MAG TPA: class I SAM-dependent methyltransferase [Streptomyces sp.]